MGPLNEQFETLVATRADCRYGISVCSGTCGLHLALLALNIGPGDEVITTPFSFIASANVIKMVGAKPVFVDIDPKTLNMDPSRIEAAITPKTKAILAVETFGNPALMDQYALIGNRHEIPVIEDCCEALGSMHKGRPAGYFGRVGVFGFYPNKQITTGEGGMIVTDDQRLADMCRSLRNQGRAIPSRKEDPKAETGAKAGPASLVTGSWLHHEQSSGTTIASARLPRPSASGRCAASTRSSPNARPRHRCTWTAWAATPTWCCPPWTPSRR